MVVLKLNVLPNLAYVALISKEKKTFSEDGS